MENRSISIESLHSFIGLLLRSHMVGSFLSVDMSGETWKDGTFILNFLLSATLPLRKEKDWVLLPQIWKT